jgi:fimbrial chaperone protein
MIKRFCLLALSALMLALLLPRARAADLAVMPVAVQLDRLKSRATVMVQNNGREPVTVQADVLAWQREGGQDRHAGTDALIVNPPVFTIEPGRSQVVRLGLREAQSHDHERTYRLVLREVPTPPAPGEISFSAGVRVLVALRIPVYVAPVAVQRSERWELLPGEDGSVTARVTNTGNVHLRLTSLRLSDGREQPLAEQMLGAVLLAGESRSWPLQLNMAAAGGAPLTLSVQGAQGPQHVAVHLPQR